MRKGRRRGSKYTKRIFIYIKLHDGQTILYKDIMEEFSITYPTVRYCIRWLLDRELISKIGKRLKIIEPYL